MAIAGTLSLAAPALAQDAPLTTLLLPHPAPLTRTDPLAGENDLYGDRPLSRPDNLSGGGQLSGPTRRDRAGAGSSEASSGGCDRRAGADRRPGTVGGVATGGSGPGEYSRFVNDGRGPAAKPPTPTARRENTAAPGTLPADRPLYGGVDRPLWGDGKPANAAGSDEDEASAPPQGVDRPLWNDPTQTSAQPTPCTDEASGRGKVPDLPTSTLFFGTGPAR